MNGKDKCKILKEIRKQIAENNNIEWVTSECKHKGECTGTCPKCESEVRKLERELSIRRNLGLAVSVVGISTLCLTAFTGCSNILPTGGQIAGDMQVVESLDGEIATMPETEVRP